MIRYKLRKRKIISNLLWDWNICGLKMVEHYESTIENVTPEQIKTYQQSLMDIPTPYITKILNWIFLKANKIYIEHFTFYLDEKNLRKRQKVMNKLLGKKVDPDTSIEEEIKEFKK